MIRSAWGALAALAAAAPALAQEGGPIRTGEHGGFTRVVMIVEPTTEWSLESADDEAVIFFPGRRLAFGLDGVFDRIPRSRVTRIDAEVRADGTRVAVALGCDCRITASFVGARYLALDVADRGAPRPAAAPPPSEADEAARARREAGAVAAAEQALVAQIARAADQGIVLLAPKGPPAAAAPPPRVAPAAPAEPPAAAPAERAQGRATVGVAPAPGPSPAAEAAAEAEAAETVADLASLDQVEAISVYDRDSSALAALRPPPALPRVCIDDAAFDAGAWSNGLALHAQTPELTRRAVGEFDRPDPEALRDLARLYIRFGFGAEAESLLAGFDAEVPERALLADLARAVEGRPVAPRGPLAVAEPCPGRHGLWLALAGAAPAFHDPAHFATVHAAFAEMPADLRALTGPILTTRLLEAGRPADAALVHATTVRPGAPPSDAVRLAAARLDAAEGRTPEATAALVALAESNAPLATDALAELTRLALDAGLAIPERTIVDLRAAALLERGAGREAALRGLIVEALAARGALPEALAEARAAAAALPAARAQFAALGAATLASADPARVGAGAYAEAALAGAGLIAAGPAGDPARRLVAGRLVEVGLANAALDVLAPSIRRGDPASRLLAARAELALGDPEAALAALDALGGPEALSLRAAALARGGAPGAALALLAEAGAETAALDYAWPSGDWTRARAAATDPGRAAMAHFMAERAGAAPGARGEGAAAGAAADTGGPDAASPADAETLAPSAEAAIVAPLPPLAAPSLAAARRLLAAGEPIGGFLDGLLAQD